LSRYVRLPSGTEVNIEDLPLEVVYDVAVGNGVPDREWFAFAYGPGAYPHAAVALLRLVAERKGETVPPEYLTVGNVVSVFPERNGDDRPTEYLDGIPKAEGDPETT
jgi:hypothetical protein